jgi:ELWxxDGT repeat protein
MRGFFARACRLAVWGLVWAGLATPAVAVDLVRDVNATRVPTLVFDIFGVPRSYYGSLPEQLTPLGERLLFTANDGVHGVELWVSDGTTEGTVLVADICPRGCSSKPLILGTDVRNVYFLANDETHGFEPWVSDGTAEGTRLLVDLCPGPCGQDTTVRPGAMGASARGLFYFAGRDGTGRAQMVVTQGTPETTRRATQLTPALRDDHLTRLLGTEQAVFVVERSAYQELWATMGYVESQRKIATACGGQPGRFTDLVAIAPFRLLTTEACTSGANRVVLQEEYSGTIRWQFELAEGYRVPSDLTKVGSRVYFTVTDAVEAPSELWVTNLVDPPVRVATLDRIEFLAAAGDRAVFLGHEDGEVRLWQSNGTPQGTLPTSALAVAWDRTVTGYRAPVPLATVDGKAVFVGCDATAGCEPRTWDPATGETLLLGDLAPFANGSEPTRFTAAGDRVFLSATRPGVDTELWAFDRRALNPGRCVPRADRLCLQQNRFGVEVRFRGPNASRLAQAQTLTNESGAFWFFDVEVPEIYVKVLDGRPVNGSFWAFWGSLSDVEHEIVVTDFETGRELRRASPQGNLCGGVETGAFPDTSTATASPAVLVPQRLQLAPRAEKLSPPACFPSDERACIGVWGANAITVRFRDPVTGLERPARVFASRFGWAAFSFFDAGNPELVVKIVEAAELNQHAWVFYASLSDVEYTLTVDDGFSSGRERSYLNPKGRYCGEADVEAFPRR